VVWRLTGLESLTLEDDHVIALPADITLLTRLTHLSLQAVSMSELPGAMSCLVNLRELEVKSHHLAALLEGATSLTQLTRVVPERGLGSPTCHRQCRRLLTHASLTGGRRLLE
jgi:Leucine-rich repeat (LRR) protein